MEPTHLSNIQFAVCPMHQLQLNYVCYHTTCTKRSLICATCMVKEHNTHDKMPLKELLEKMDNRKYDQRVKTRFTSLIQEVKAQEESLLA